MHVSFRYEKKNRRISIKFCIVGFHNGGHMVSVHICLIGPKHFTLHKTTSHRIRL